MKTKSDSDRQEVSRKIDKYWVPIIARTIELLDCFGSAAESLTLEEAPRKRAGPRISYCAGPTRAECAAFNKESHIQFR
jgi:ribose transport system substrate-binding protein